MMSMRTNVGAMFALRQMQIHRAAISRSMMRISSGFRINSAADDAAGLAISERMRGQIRGMTMASRNTRQSINMLDTAWGGLNETHAMLQRMRELVVQAAHSPTGDAGAALINLEFQELIRGINGIAGATHYNNINLIDGTFGGEIGGQGLARIGVGDINISGGYLRGNGTLTIRRDDGGEFEAVLRIGDDMIRGQAVDAGGNPVASNHPDAVAITFEFENIDGSPRAQVRVELDPGGDLREGVAAGILFGGGVTSTARTVTANTNDRGTLQIGANGGADQRMNIRMEDMSAIGLGIWDLDISTVANAQAVLDSGVLDDAIDKVSRQRASISAQVSRLEHTYNNLQNSIENLTAAESTIRDADIAAEMMNLARATLLLQTSQAMMAQAMQLERNFIMMMLRSME